MREGAYEREYYFCKNTDYDIQVSVNLEKAGEIKEYIRAYLFDDED